MIVDDATVCGWRYLTGPGKHIPDDEIGEALRHLEGVYRFKGMALSEGMHRLLRCWCDKRQGLAPEIVSDEASRHEQEVQRIASSIGGNFLYLGWLIPFEICVLNGSMSRIHLWASNERAINTKRTLIQQMHDVFNEELAEFEPSTVEAVRKLHDAADLLGLPRGYFVSRKIDVEINQKWDFSNAETIRFTRAPDIEAYLSIGVDQSPNLHTRETAARVAEVLDAHDEDLKYVGKGGKQSFERWAVRRMWAGITDAFKLEQAQPDMDKPWVTVSEILDLCGVDVDPEVVRKTIKKPPTRV